MTGLLLTLRRVTDIAARTGAVISAGAILFACIAISWAVLARGIVGMNTIWELEAGVYLLIYAAFLSAGFAHRDGGQIAVDMLRERLTGRARIVHRGLLDAVALALFVLLAVSGWHMTAGAWETGWRSETLWGPPLWLPYLAVPLGSVLISFCLAVDIALRLAGVPVPQDHVLQEAH
ncbi:TRAP transporter small permease [Roseivivax isoporae]|uniref:TRAP transporter small permease protein n=1 Tax=Roseivivax isoporae LMG 25204 TaxID=1449351 RepID=X7F6Y6_9RHOB|nr:TRAP transporter small permease [Roseivivax isoporae]ETX27849.1 hypothetical protein RISW2_10980 [Roseivivax isoporae LMG 25204]